MAKQPVVKRTPAKVPEPVQPKKSADPLNQAPNLVRGKYTSKTANGYELMEVISTLQKEVRRGNEKAALFWAFELQESTNPNNACGYGKYMWKRLTIMASEDMGMINPMAAVMVDTLRRSYELLCENYKKVPSNATECLVQVILYLCRSPKNRECDDALIWMMCERAQGNMLPIPDYALDNHTLRGKRKGRHDLSYFFEESAKLENVQGPNHYAPMIGDKANVDRYDGHDEPVNVHWEPVNVPEKEYKKDHMYAKTAGLVLKGLGKSGQGQQELPLTEDEDEGVEE